MKHILYHERVVPLITMKHMTNEEKTHDTRGILVVEDEPFLVDAYRVKFAKEGVPARFVSDGMEALALLRGEPPALVLLDILLPGISGFEILKAIKENERWKNVPVLVLSNLSQPKDVGRCMELGASEFIVKADTKINDIALRVKKYL